MSSQTITGTATTVPAELAFDPVQNLVELTNNDDREWVRIKLSYEDESTGQLEADPGETTSLRADYDKIEIYTNQFTVEYTLTATDDVNDPDELKAEMEKFSYKTILKPVTNRDTSLNFTSREVPSSQTGTTRVVLLPQFDTQDIVLVFGNFYEDGSSRVWTPNTNSISIKASLEINGEFYPVYFGKDREITIEGGGVAYSNPVPCLITPDDSVYIRTYFDTGDAANYIPLNTELKESGGNDVYDGITYGSDLVDSGDVDNASSDSGYTAMAIFGLANQNNSVLLVGNSIINGTGDAAEQSMASTGFAARRLKELGIGSTKISFPGQNSTSFLNGFPHQQQFTKNHDSVILHFGTNDLSSGKTVDELKTNYIKIWNYYSKAGLEVYACTIPPLTTSTDNWFTLENQTVGENEDTRLELNTWLRTEAVSENESLTGVFDTSAEVEDMSTGKWIVPDAPEFSGTITGVSTNYIDDSDSLAEYRELDSNGYILITSGVAVGELGRIQTNGFGDTRFYIFDSWETTPEIGDSYEIYFTPTGDGTHPRPSYHQKMGKAITL